ncbi:MAG: peptidylprolyl isomerase, partial [Planctomycetales bacterium]|nr:peptidylprolyl isomerase [Planctomycetales bacterium]
QVRTADLRNATGGSQSRSNRTAAPNGDRDATAAKQTDANWWKEDAEQTIGTPEKGSYGRSVSPRGEVILSTEILAWVGNEPILAGDFLGRINEAIQPAIGKVPPEELDKQRWLLMERMLPNAIEAKMVYLDFTRQMQREQIESVRANVYKQFDEKQMPRMVEQAKLRSPAELEAQLRSYGSSLDTVRRSFFEQVAAREIIRRSSEDDREVTHDQLLEFYEAHLGEYEYPAKAKWEHLMARFSQFKSKREAKKAIAAMGNAVLEGAKLEVVARRSSQGPLASDGGQFDWTTRGSLASSVLDEAIFSFPVGELSPILEDEEGFHIIRVIARQDAGRTSFLDAQSGIRDKIKEERRDAKVKEYLEKLKRETYVWNRFEEEQRGKP